MIASSMPSTPRNLRVLLLGAILASAFSAALCAGDKPEIFPLKQVQPGMKGVAYTIFSGDQIEKMDFEVLGVLPNTLGPKTDVILVELKGPKVEHSGVVAGMSGSPAYIDGKLLGAIALKLGTFSKEAIAGIMPIEQMLDVQNAQPSGSRAASISPSADGLAAAAQQVALPSGFAQQIGLGSDNFLVPIDTPLVFSGFYPQALARYSSQLAGFGLTTVAGGSAAPRPDDNQIQPGDMVGMSLVRGDMSLTGGCTVTAIVEDRVFVCGHPLFGLGSVQLPLVRARVVTTLNSDLESFKILTTGGVIGTVTQDRLTAVMGRLGAGPRMIPVEIDLSTPTQNKKFHFEVMEDPKLTPLLVGLATFNGIVSNTAYSEGATLQLDGTIELKGHSPVQLENLFAPTDVPAPDGFFVASTVQNTFARIFDNPYEQPQVEDVRLRVKSLPDKRLAAIESAWSEKSEVHPGDTLRIKVLLRPYRGAIFLQEVPITIPLQVTRGPLRVLISDSEMLNRMQRFGPQAQVPGLEELINLLNRERNNDRLYVTLLQPSPTLLVGDKELPDVPLSAINVLDQRRNPGGATLLGESTIGEWSVPMNQVVSGQQYLTIMVQ
jgi:hypothetical protein